MIDERPKQTGSSPEPGFISDAVRTLIGCYGGAFAGVRADETGAAFCRRWDGAPPAADYGRWDDILRRLRQPGRRGQPQCRAYVGAAAGGSRRRHHQPPVRFGMDAIGQAGGRPALAKVVKLMMAGGVEA